MGPDIEGGHGLLRLGKRRSPCRVVGGTREENTGRGGRRLRGGFNGGVQRKFYRLRYRGGAQTVEIGEEKKPLPSSGGRQRRIQGGDPGGSGAGSMAVCISSLMDPIIERGHRLRDWEEKTPAEYEE